MKKPLFLMASAALLSCAGDPAPFETRHDWTEPADPAAENTAVWAFVDGPVVSFGSTDVRYPRSEPYGGTVVGELCLTGWRGERVSAQAVVSAPGAIGGLRCRVGDFVSTDGTKLRGIARARFVKYVLSDRFDPDNACGARPEGRYPAHLEADLLDEAPRLDVAAATTRPVWITVRIPHDAAAGRYTAPVEIEGRGVRKTLDVHLEVVDRTLPLPSEWAYHLDLWQHPSSVARVENVPLWSDEHFKRMLPTMTMLADAGQKVITATLNKDPWNNQCYDPYADMIVWTRLADGTWEYDFTVFDRWVRFMLELGIDKYINCYSMLPWNNMLHYRDAVTGETVDVRAEPGTPEFRAMWAPFLPAFVEHLRANGWLPITNIAMDERAPEVMAEATALLAEVAPELGIALADNHKIFKQYPYIRDMCAGISGPIDCADIDRRRAGRLTTTYYVCCSSGFPNTYTSSPPAEAVYLSWHAAALGYDGFLRWAYNSWTADPIRDSRFRSWAAGDTYMVYPEGRSSVRFERLIEGIQDWEKIRLLREEFSAGSGEEPARRLARLDSLLAPFASRTAFAGWSEKLDAARRELNAL